MIKTALSILFTGCALVLGVYTSFLAAENRDRGDRLDEAQRWCEAQSRRNEVLRAANYEREWKLISGEEGVWLEDERGDS